MMNKLMYCICLQLKLMISRSTGRLGFGKKAAKNGMVLLIGALLIYLSVFYSVNLLSSLPEQQRFLVVYLMAAASVCMVFFVSIQLAQGNLFAFKDFDFLMSLPISKSTVMISKIVSFLLLCYGYCGLLLIPALILYGIAVQASVFYYLFALFGFLFLPLVPLVLSSIVALCIRVLAGRSRWRSLITNTLSFLIFGLIFVASFSLSFSSNDPTMNLDAGMITEPIMRFLPFVGLYAKALVEGDLFAGFLSCLMGIAAFVLFVFIFNRTFIQVNSNLQEGYHIKNYQLKKLEQNSCLTTLFKKELQKVFGNFMYIMNLAVGQILLIVGAVYVLFNRQHLFAVLDQFPIGAVDEMKSAAFVLICGLCIVFGLMSNTSAVSISLEGKNLWIVQSLPIKAQELFLSKILVNAVIIAVPSTIALILMSFAFQFSILMALIGLLLIGSLSLFVGLFGIVINLHFPRLEFDREILVIKQSAASFIAIFGGLLLGGGCFFLIISGLHALDPLLLIGILVLGFAGMDFILWYYLNHAGVRLFNKL